MNLHWKTLLKNFTVNVKNKKGVTLAELVISAGLIILVSIGFFQITKMVQTSMQSSKRKFDSYQELNSLYKEVVKQVRDYNKNEFDLSNTYIIKNDRTIQKYKSNKKTSPFVIKRIQTYYIQKHEKSLYKNSFTIAISNDEYMASRCFTVDSGGGNISYGYPVLSKYKKTLKVKCRVLNGSSSNDFYVITFYQKKKTDRNGNISYIQKVFPAGFEEKIKKAKGKGISNKDNFRGVGFMLVFNQNNTNYYSIYTYSLNKVKSAYNVNYKVNQGILKEEGIKDTGFMKL